MAKRISILTLGCRVNHCESAALADRARAAGLEVVEWGLPAEYGVVNSCALTVLAEAKTRQAVRIFARANPSAEIAVAGCYAQTNPQKVAELPNVKWVVGNAEKMRCIDIMLSNVSSQRPLQFVEFCGGSDSEKYSSGTTPLSDRMNLKIQDGCDNACSYCIIPRARGIPRSRDFSSIVADAENLVSRGVREIVLTGINISKFSSARGGLPELVDALNAIPQLFRIRIGSVEPPDFWLDALLERIADSSHKLMPHLHISAQSLSDTVLGAMRRKYRARDFLEIVERIKTVSPDICVGTDIICGHPSETDAEYENTKRDFVRSGLSYAHIFTFSPRPRTLAAAMNEGVVPPEIRKARADDLRKIAASVHDAFLKSQFGVVRRVLLENMLSDGSYLSRTDNYMHTRVKIGESGLKNRLAEVEIIGKDGRAGVCGRLVRLL